MKALFISLAVAGVVTGLVLVLLFRPATTVAPEATQQASETVETPPAETLAEGRYIEYDEPAVTADGYSETIIFFHAGWCPECRAFDQAIQLSTIPAGTQILKLDYDSSTELREKYEVTLQSTFVKVDQDGALLTKWVGYGRDKSVEAILENT